MMKLFALGCLLATGAVLGGCDTLGVEVNAPILEAAGLTTKSKKEREPDLPQRAGLVVPPTSDLPPPGPRQQVAASGWVNDPDEQAKAKRKDEEAAHKKYCADRNWNRVKEGGQSGASLVEDMSPATSQRKCQSLLGDSLNQSFNRSDGSRN